MASNAFTDYLEPLLADAEELVDAHTKLRTGKVGRQWGLGAVNRAVVVMSVSAWEAYVEEVVKEALQAIKPPSPPSSVWPALNANALSLVGRFNNPTTDNVKNLIASTIGLEDVTVYWYWRNCSVTKARDLLRDALRYRHQIAHGVNPRPTIHNGYSSWLPGFFRRLGECTDYGVWEFIDQELGIKDPWPM